jgi:hypothetical protein
LEIPQAGGFDVQVLTDRLLRLARLDTSVFDEVKSDVNATIPAVVVAVAATLLAGIGGLLWWIVEDYGDTGEFFFKSVILGGIFAVALWVAWLAVVYAVLTQVFREQTDVYQLLRTMGHAAAPLGLGVLMFIPGVDFGLALASIALFFGLTTIAIQATTQADPAKVLVANTIGFTVWAAVLAILASDDNVFAPGIFVFDSIADGVGSLLDIGNAFG